MCLERGQPDVVEVDTRRGRLGLLLANHMGDYEEALAQIGEETRASLAEFTRQAPGFC